MNHSSNPRECEACEDALEKANIDLAVFGTGRINRIEGGHVEYISPYKSGCLIGDCDAKSND